MTLVWLFVVVWIMIPMLSYAEAAFGRGAKMNSIGPIGNPEASANNNQKVMEITPD